MNAERAFPLQCLKSDRNSGSNGSIFVLFSVFKCSKPLLPYVKRACESINICRFDKQYNLTLFIALHVIDLMPFQNVKSSVATSFAPLSIYFIVLGSFVILILFSACFLIFFIIKYEFCMGLIMLVNYISPVDLNFLIEN